VRWRVPRNAMRDRGKRTKKIATRKTNLRQNLCANDLVYMKKEKKLLSERSKSPPQKGARLNCETYETRGFFLAPLNEDS